TLRRHIATFRAGIATLRQTRPELGLELTDAPAAIQPLIVGSDAAALGLAARLDAAGLWVPAVWPPTVPVGTARLRVTHSADHTETDLKRLLDALGHSERHRHG
ncbi:MAG: aminotransferase class I/II-fold pyridoxal phosphate-dependent enzyme, partial [Solirubrobacteraceae bacterium]|nr:aminotransferase class I/II-fold pyridoxal phosphate-dependent enzyme [Solirubrobacteraceae bacterium]